MSPPYPGFPHVPCLVCQYNRSHILDLICKGKTTVDCPGHAFLPNGPVPRIQALRPRPARVMRSQQKRGVRYPTASSVAHGLFSFPDTPLLWGHGVSSLWVISEWLHGTPSYHRHSPMDFVCNCYHGRQQQQGA